MEINATCVRLDSCCPTTLIFDIGIDSFCNSINLKIKSVPVGIKIIYGVGKFYLEAGFCTIFIDTNKVQNLQCEELVSNLVSFL